MKDERLGAGRHHLDLARTAEARGHWDDARLAYESALVQFAGPELKIGEGHALRGLAGVALAEGDVVRAEQLLHQSVQCYRTVRSLLDALDNTGVATELRVAAMEAEAIAQVQLGELFLRSGRLPEAQEARDWARAAYDTVRHRPSEAAVYALTGRIAARIGEFDEALLAYERALAVHEAANDVRGAASSLISIAEVQRLLGASELARGAYKRAHELARETFSPSLEARSLGGMALLAREQGDLVTALLAYEQVLKLSEEHDDVEMQGFAHLNLGDIRSREQRGQPVQHFRSAVEILSGLGVAHGVGAALYHASTHAVRAGHPLEALALAEGARRIWRELDPVRGVGQALRVMVKSLAAMGGTESTYLIAAVRADIAGRVQPNAVAVADYYGERVPASVLRDVSGWGVGERAARCEHVIVEVLQPLLDDTGLQPSDLGSRAAALTLLDRLQGLGDQRGLAEVEEADLEHLPDEADFHVLTNDDLLPPVAR